MQLQRALNMDDFEEAQDIRTRREQIDEVVAKQLVYASSLLSSITPVVQYALTAASQHELCLSPHALPLALVTAPFALQPAEPSFFGCGSCTCCQHAQSQHASGSGLAQPVCHDTLHLGTLLQASKGPGCGSRAANQTAVADLASEGLRLRSELQRAIDEERYADAAQMRDRIKAVQVSPALLYC